MAGMFESYSNAQLFFLFNTAVFALMFLYSWLTGTYMDVKQQMHGIPDQMGWFQFRKRVVWVDFLGIITGLWMLWNILSSYYFGSAPGHIFSELHQFFFSPSTASVESTSVFLAIVALLLVRLHRYHIALNVSVFSHRQAYNIFQAFGFYSMVLLGNLSLLAEAEPFVQQPDLFSLSSFHLTHLVGVVLLFFSTKVHGDVHRALTKLRKNRFGHITTTEYKMPKGGWFDVVTCPHYLAEIVMFIAIGVILDCRSCTWWSLTAFVVVNQIFAALETHRFYCQKFEDYNKNHKVIIPFVF